MTEVVPRLSGTFLVTGGTGGIGRAISILFARAGACVVVNYGRNEASAQELKTLADREQLRIVLCRANLMVPEAFRHIEAAIEQTAVPLCGFIHCAAIGPHRPFTELTGPNLDWTLAVNVRAFFELMKVLLPRFTSGSSVVAVSSPGAMRAVPYYSAIGTSKGALESLARHLAVELAPRGIRVNILAPGAVATGAWNVIPDGAARLAEATSRSPLGRLVTPEEVAWTAHFLCSSSASGINGHTLVVDGGASILA